MRLWPNHEVHSKRIRDVSLLGRCRSLQGARMNRPPQVTELGKRISGFACALASFRKTSHFEQHSTTRVHGLRMRERSR